MAKKKQSRGQKRKGKLEKRRGKSPTRSLAYHGKRYRSDKFVPAIAQAEIGILESYVMTDRELTDGQVKAALTELIGDLRRRGYQPASFRDVVEVTPETYTDLVIWNIRRNWDDLFHQEPRHSNGDLVGILRTILGSVEIWSTPSASSRGYLNYIEGFLGQMSVEPQLIPWGSDEQEEEPVAPSDEEILLDLGEKWLGSDDSQTRKEFFRRGLTMVERGRANAVINVCQRLIGHRTEKPFIEDLRPLLQPAYRQLGVPASKGPSDQLGNLPGGVGGPD